jgi:hypothetical protein
MSDEVASVGVDIEWMGGLCPVQAEGTFDGVEFYFRARGTSVTVDVGENWTWYGPEYEWPDAGWISEETARSYVNEAYACWRERDKPRCIPMRKLRKQNDNRDRQWMYTIVAADLKRNAVEGSEQAQAWLMAEAARLGTPTP